VGVRLPGASICLKVCEGPVPLPGLFKGIFRTAQSLPTFPSSTLSLPTLPLPHRFPSPTFFLPQPFSPPFFPFLSLTILLPLFPSPICPHSSTTPSLPSPVPFLGGPPLNPSTRLGERCKLPSGSGWSPSGHQTACRTFWAKKSASGDNNVEEFSVEQIANMLDKKRIFDTKPEHQHNCEVQANNLS